MSSFKPKFDKLNDSQLTLWPQLASAAQQGFVLYGGTGLALRLGHRATVDFDFFNDRPLHKETLRNALQFLNDAQTIQDEPNSLTVIAPVGDGDVKVSFFGNLKIGRIAVPDYTEDGVCQVASMIDLFATKLKTIFDRIEAKDYRDILAIVTNGLPLEKGLAAASAMYGPQFQPSELLKALTYFEGGDLDQLTRIEREMLARAASSVETIPEMRRESNQLSA